MNRRDFIRQMGSYAVTAGTATLLVEGMFLKRLGASPISLDSLRKSIGSTDGIILIQKDSDYSKHRDGFNLRFQIVPQVIVLCKTSKAVAEALGWARTNNVPVRPRSGGHSYEGLSTCEGIVIDVSPMNEMSIDASSRTARLGAGCKLGKVYEVVAAKGLAIVAGSCGTVGVAGLTLGGGYGLLSRKFGTTSDNLLSLKMVLADGSVVTASASENADLFWACRGGGGGNFGIATEFTFKLHPVSKVVTFAFKWSSSDAKKVLQAWQNLAPQFDDEITSLLKITGVAGSGIQPVKLVGQYVAKSEGHTPSENDLRSLLKPLTSIGSSTELKIATRTFSDAVAYFSGGDDPAVCFKAKSDYARDPVSGDGIDQLLKQLGNLSTGAVAALCDSYGGALNRVPADATAFPHRDRLFSVQYYSQWAGTSKSPANIEQMRKVYGAMRPYFSGHSYVNYIDLDLTDWQRAYYGDNFQRLTQVKAVFDPENVFNGPQCIPLP